jgi:3-hydroxy-5-methyl-1-naphthoate 3-O-methyltransferase
VNMFAQKWPLDHDAHFLSNIFHDWDEQGCTLLARRSFEALPSGGKIFLHEMLMDDDCCGPLHATLFSLVMLLGTKGRQYSFGELSKILADAGFVDIDARATPHGYYSIISAQKP